MKRLLHDCATLQERNTSLTESLNHRHEEIAEVQKMFQKEFENLAARIFESSRTALTKDNKEQVDLLLRPLREKLGEFQQTVESTNKEHIKTNADLLAQIRQLAQMNQVLSDDAKSLTKALK